MSASLLVDLGNTCDYRTSVIVGSGSNLAVGEIVDLNDANTLCNIFIAGGIGSGAIEIRVQTSDGLTSGSFVDPTSGFPQFPAIGLLSGGIYWANSGLWASGGGSKSSPVNNAPMFCSGGFDSTAFQRPQRYARLIYNSGPFLNSINAGFISNKRTTGSGGGFSLLPTSGSVNV